MVMVPVSTTVRAELDTAINQQVHTPPVMMYDWVQRNSYKSGFIIAATTSAYIHIRPEGFDAWDDLALFVTPDNSVFIYDPNYTQEHPTSNPDLGAIPIQFRRLFLDYGIIYNTLILRSRLKPLT